MGWARLQQLERAFGTLAAAWRIPSGQLSSLPGFGAEQIARIEAHRQRWGPDPLVEGRWCAPGPSRVLLPGDPASPPALAQLERPPLALHWQGRGSLWPQLRRRLAIAVVGTRRPSLHGRSMARAIGAALAEAGWPVVSGLAEGIDAAAHRGCLDRAGRPVGVLGTPLDRVYPRHHTLLQAAVAREGLLITEQPPEAMVRRGHFAARNRLQVALARAVVVVECPHGSGALHSARLAWEQGLPLWVVPADAGKASAAGSNTLLLRGATPLLDPQDLITQLGLGPLARRAEVEAIQPAPLAPSTTPPPPQASEASLEESLLRALGSGTSLEQLCLALGRPPAELSCHLLRLELAGRIQAEPGLCWRRC
jgi:DNA processing protein